MLTLSRLIKALFILLLTAFLFAFLRKNVTFDGSIDPNHPTISISSNNEIIHNDDGKKQNVNNSSALGTLLHQFIVANTQHTTAQYKAFFELWMSKDPQGIMIYLLNLKDKDVRLSMLLLAMATWSDIDSGAFNIWLLTTKTSTTLDLAIFELSQSNLIASPFAIQYTEKISDIELRNQSITHIIQKWISSDMFDAIDWVNQNNLTFQQYGLQVYSLAIEEDIDLVLSSLYLLSDKPISMTAPIVDAISTKIFQLVNEEEFDADNIALTLLSLSNNDVSETIIEAILPLILTHSTTENAISLIDNISDSDFHDAMQQKMVGILMERDIPAALNFIHYFESDDKRQQTFDTIISYWAKQDLSAASDWLSSVDIGNSNAGFSLAEIAIQKKEVNIAKKWVKEIEDSYDVDEMHYLIFNLLYQEDIDSAVNYLNEQTHFSEQEVLTILSAMNDN